MEKYNQSQLEFLAKTVADIDWQKTCSNDNPYSKNRNPIQWQAYENRIDDVLASLENTHRARITLP